MIKRRLCALWWKVLLKARRSELPKWHHRPKSTAIRIVHWSNGIANFGSRIYRRIEMRFRNFVFVILHRWRRLLASVWCHRIVSLSISLDLDFSVCRWCAIWLPFDRCVSIESSVFVINSWCRCSVGSSSKCTDTRTARPAAGTRESASRRMHV